MEKLSGPFDTYSIGVFRHPNVHLRNIPGFQNSAFNKYLHNHTLFLTNVNKLTYEQQQAYGIMSMFGSLVSLAMDSSVKMGEHLETMVAQKGQTQISLPKHKTVSQNTNQFPKTQISLPKHKSMSQKHKSAYQNTKQFLKTQTNFPKHKSVYQNTNQFHKTQTNFAKHKSKDWALALSLSESLEATHSHDFLRPTWRLLSSKMFCHNCGSKELQECFYCSQCGTKLDVALPSFR